MKLTRERWDAMTPDEQWEHVNRAPFQIGELVQVQSFVHNNFPYKIKPFTGYVTDTYFESRFGWWFYSVSDENEDTTKRHWVTNWPEPGIAAVANE